MHLVEQYALASGSKIDKPQIREKYYPVPADNYLTFSPFSKPSKNYDLWREVLSIIQEPLGKLGVSIVQLGEHKDSLFDGCIDLRGKTSIAQCAFLIKRSLLHFGADTFSVHIASAYDKKVVALYSHSPMQNQKGYWNKNSEFVGIESYKDGKQHSFMLEEDPKTINTIEPEKVAMSIFRLLGIDVKIKKPSLIGLDILDLNRLFLIKSFMFLFCSFICFNMFVGSSSSEKSIRASTSAKSLVSF